MKIYHNPRCTKSREALQYLESKKIVPEVKLYLNEKMTQKEVKEILAMLDIAPIEIIRKTENDYKEHVKGKGLSNAALIKAIVTYPKLLQRPIIVKGKKAVIARPLENLKNFLKQ